MSPTVAVFGSSEPRSGEPLYEVAMATGRALAVAGFTVLTGGYGGVMEAVSRGARAGGGEAVGVVVSSVFCDREPNEFLTETVDAADLYERTRVLIDRADAYVVLGGKAGTLAELAWVWALARAGCLPPRPVVTLDDPWAPLLELLESSDMLDPVARKMTSRARDAADAVAILERRLAGD